MFTKLAGLQSASTDKQLPLQPLLSLCILPVYVMHTPYVRLQGIGTGTKPLDELLPQPEYQAVLNNQLVASLVYSTCLRPSPRTLSFLPLLPPPAAAVGSVVGY